MRKIGILYRPQRDDSTQLAEATCSLLRRRGVAVWCGAAGEEDALRQAAPDLDLLVTLAGDGTIVRAARTVAIYSVPILGVNLGRLGFLAEVEPEGVLEAIPALLEGEYTVEDRMMLHTELRRHGKLLLQTEVINDVFMGRGCASRTVNVSVEVDGHHVMRQTADGIIVSTPTGTTAYCLAAGGPIVAPDSNCITITPVAAHLSIAHAIVIPSHRSLCLELTQGQGAMLTVDGQVDVPLVPGDRVHNRVSKYTAKFVRFGGDGSFYETILRRLRWPDRGQTP